MKFESILWWVHVATSKISCMHGACPFLSHAPGISATNEFLSPLYWDENPRPVIWGDLKLQPALPAGNCYPCNHILLLKYLDTNTELNFQLSSGCNWVAISHVVSASDLVGGVVTFSAPDSIMGCYPRYIHLSITGVGAPLPPDSENYSLALGRNYR